MTTLQFTPKDEDLLLAPDAATAMRQGGNSHETFLRTLEYCGAHVQLHDVLLVLHQRFDNVPSDIEDIDGYWSKLDMAVRSVHPRCRGIATKYPQQSIQPQAALRADEGPIIRKVYDTWLAKTYVDMKTASCYYVHDVNDTLTPLLIAEKTDDEVTTIAWTIPPLVERRYNEWFKDDGCPRGRINATTNAPENEDFEVSIDIYGPSFCQREAMGEEELAWYKEKRNRNKIASWEVIYDKGGMLKPTPRYEFQASNPEEQIPWTWIAEGHRQCMKQQEKQLNAINKHKPQRIHRTPSQQAEDKPDLVSMEGNECQRPSLSQLLQGKASLETRFQGKRLDRSKTRKRIPNIDETIIRNAKSVEDAQETIDMLIMQGTEYKQTKGERLLTLKNKLDTDLEAINQERMKPSTDPNVKLDGEAKLTQLRVDESLLENRDEQLMRSMMRRKTL